MTDYDEVPYECQPIPCTAPEQLALVSYVHGGPCPPVRGMRYLEIGCGDGANLLPLAFHRPDSTFVGIDASRVQIADALRSTRELGLTNLRFHAADVREVADELGRFDVIAVHGVLSWVPADVRSEILSLCRAQLTTHGILYANYNTYPGWKTRGLVRDAIRRAAGPGPELRSRAEDARQLADFLSRRVGGIDHPYARLLRMETDRVVDAREAYLVHEYLTEHNHPFWLREFVDLAAEHGLRHVVEADFNQPTHRVPHELRQAVEALGREPLVTEELIDVLWYRQHRTAVLCRADAPVLDDPGSALLERTTIATGLQPRSAGGAPGSEPESFVGFFEPEVSFEFGDPLVRTTLATLAANWPAGMAWGPLLSESARRMAAAGLPRPDAEDERRLQARLRELFRQGQVEFRLREVPARTRVPDEPIASPLARYEAARRAILTCPGHHRLGLLPIDRLVVPRLDGTRPPASVAREVAAQIRAGALSGQGEADTDSREGLPDRIDDRWVAEQIDRIVSMLAMWGLLQA